MASFETLVFLEKAVSNRSDPLQTAYLLECRPVAMLCWRHPELVDLLVVVTDRQTAGQCLLKIIILTPKSRDSSYL